MNKIGQILKERGIKQKWLAKKLGVSETTVSNWCREKNNPHPKHILRFCKLLNVEIHDYLKSDED